MPIINEGGFFEKVQDLELIEREREYLKWLVSSIAFVGTAKEHFDIIFGFVS